MLLCEKGVRADHEIRGKEMDLIIDFFEREGVPDVERITDSNHDLVSQEDSRAEVLIRKTGLQNSHGGCLAVPVLKPHIRLAVCKTCDNCVFLCRSLARENLSLAEEAHDSFLKHGWSKACGGVL